MILFEKGFYLKDADLWMDSTRVKPQCYLSHAHSDHTAKHKHIISTPETAALACHRLGNRPIKKVPYHQWAELNGVRFKLFPAGHILGSSQILIETDSFRLVYTGDFRMGKSRTAKEATAEECDILIMESTYGSPQYTFPDRSEVEEEFVSFIVESLNTGQKPVVMAYTLGKAQEAMAILSARGINFTVERSIYKIAKIYERFGVKFGDYSLFKGGYFEDVLIIPPHMRKFRNIISIPNAVFIMLTGWGKYDKNGWVHNADKTFIISDHSDYSSLIGYVQQVNPKKIYTLHGFDDFAVNLRSQGFEAEAMVPGKEYKLNGGSIHPVNIDLFD